MNRKETIELGNIRGVFSLNVYQKVYVRDKVSVRFYAYVALSVARFTVQNVVSFPMFVK